MAHPKVIAGVALVVLCVVGITAPLQLARSLQNCHKINEGRKQSLVRTEIFKLLLRNDARTEPTLKEKENDLRMANNLKALSTFSCGL